MAGHELIDEFDLMFYLAAMEALEGQKERVLNSDDPFNEGFWENELLLLIPLFIPVILDIVKAGFLFTSTEFPSVVFEDFQRVEDFARNYAYDLVKGINETSRAQLQEIIGTSVLENWTLAETTATLEPLYGPVRGSLIAVTETTNAYQQGAHQLAEELRLKGYEVEEYWLTARDDRVCPICGPRDGMLIGENGIQPGAAHPGCRCDIGIRIL